MNIGSLLFDKEFKFLDGTKGEKILVVLNDGDSGYYIVVKTTSRSNYKNNNYGCQLKDKYPNFHLPAKSCNLFAPTWVLLDNFFEFPLNYFLDKRFSGRIKVIGELDYQILFELLKCCISSNDILMTQVSILLESLQKIQKTATV